MMTDLERDNRRKTISHRTAGVIMASLENQLPIEEMPNSAEVDA